MAKPIKLVSKKGLVRYKVDPIYKGKRLGSKTFNTAAEARKYDREVVTKASRGGVDLTRTFGEAMDKPILRVMSGAPHCNDDNACEIRVLNC